MEENTTVDRLVRMLDEERETAEKLSGRLTTTEAVAQLLNRSLDHAAADYAKLEGQLTDTQRWARKWHERLNILVQEHRKDYPISVTGVDRFPTIKSIRDRFGFSLAEATEVVEGWSREELDRENAEEIIAREDPGTFDEDENPFLREETDWTGTADYNDMVRKGLREDA